MRPSSTFTNVLGRAAFLVLFMLAAGNAPAEEPPRVSAIAPACAAPGETVSLAGHGFGAQNVAVVVGDRTAEILKATGHGADFLVPPGVLPGLTSVTVTNPGGQGGSIAFQVRGPEVCGNNIDDDCDGSVDEVAECPLASIRIDTTPFDITLSPGEVGNISTTVAFATTGSAPYTVAVTQQVAALSGPAGGIGVFPGVGGGFTSSTNKATVDNQEVEALSNGVYEITTTARILETGEVVSDVARITVATSRQAISVGVPGSDPGGLAPDTSTSVVFTAQVQGADPAAPIDVVLGGNVTIYLNDQGMDGDLIAGDGTFSGTAAVGTAGLAPGTCLSVSATATQGTASATSNAYRLCVSSLPLEPARSDVTNTVSDPKSGEPAVADEVLITVAPGTSDAVIGQIAARVGGVVAGSIPGLDVYQIRLPAPISSSAQLAQVLADLKSFHEVLEAEPNVVEKGQAVTPSDPQFTSQGALTKVRADEAWTIARGAVTIAVVDSGADLDHPDLSSKIVKGKGFSGRDFVDNTFYPEDGFGHGTHVAGIAAAATNNSEGIAGVSWGSNILVVRVLDNTNSGTAANVAAGIKYAADQGARIINCSVGSTGGESVKCAAVSYAVDKGSMVVAAAGNNGNSTLFYPAACAGAIAVGNTTLEDTRRVNSNFGSWVDLAAPGTDILSTVPVGGTCTHCNTTGYNQMSGTSMAAPLVSGAAAVVLSRQPGLSNAQVEERLKRTAVKLPLEDLGAGRIDLFEAVFNGSFEEGNLALWKRAGTAGSPVSLGPITPPHRDRMGYVSTGPSSAQTAGTMWQHFSIQPGVTSFPISFKYAFVTEEYPEWVGSVYDDSLRITLVTPSGAEIILAEESVNGSSFKPIGGIDFPEGDTTVGWTGWKAVSRTVPVTMGAGVYRIFLTDAGDAIFDTATLIDEIQFK